MAKSTWRRSDFICYNKKVKKKKNQDEFTGEVGVPYEYRSAASVSINQKAVTFWLNPETHRTPSAPVLKLWNKEIYYNAVWSTSQDRINMFAFEKRATSPISSIETALDKLRWFNAGSGTSLNSIDFDDIYFTYDNIDSTGKVLYHVLFSASVHNIFTYAIDSVNVSSIDPNIYSVPIYKLTSGSSSNFTTLYNNLDGQGVIPAGKNITFISFSNGNNLTIDEFKNIFKVYYGADITEVHTVTV